MVLEEWKALGEKRDQIQFAKNIFISSHSAHFGIGCINFGTDGLLYLAESDYAQASGDMKTTKRKMLRIDMDRKDPGKEWYSPRIFTLFRRYDTFEKAAEGRLPDTSCNFNHLVQSNESN